MEPATPLAEVHGIGLKFLTKLKKLKIETVREILYHFPTRYEDFSQIYRIADLEPNQEATIQGEIKEIGGRRTWRRHLFLVEALVSDDSGSIRIVWFNQPYIKNVLRPGRIANFSGKVVANSEEIYLSNPVYELVSDPYRETRHTGRIVPVYPETKGLTSKGLRYLVKPIIDQIEKIDEIVPKEILQGQKLPEINRAIRDIHFPNSLEDALAAKKRFAFEDIFLLQMQNLKQKLRLAREKTTAVKTGIKDIKKLLAALPFELMPSQKKSLWEIVQDLGKTHPMNRLLQGDVGSGKTIIAAIAAILTAEDNCQSAFMAPTEILAQQHFKTMTQFFPAHEGGLALLTANDAKIFYGAGLEARKEKTKLVKEIAAGRVKIVVGTHALIQKKIGFQNLALVIVDEQHRFGVEQRAHLTKNKKLVPHFLSMSATPIPRTLSLTIFGDLDISLITEMPKNRKPIITRAVAAADRAKAYSFIRGQIKRDRQAFVICPRIEKQEVSEGNDWNEWQKLEVKSVKEEYEKLSKKIFPDLKIVMLHGKMKPAEKEKVIKDFYEKRADILVSTSVVEVGIDIPNATVMMIEGADRFGLAQLYQFRGRVGRGEHQSFCFLFTDSASSATRERLKSIVEAKNGFELAEKDLKLRGPGEFLGQSQTGLPDIAMTAIQNPELVKVAREAAVKILKSDPALKNHPSLSERLNQFQKEVHWE